MKLFCTHAHCRAVTSQEVAYLGRRLDRPELEKLAEDVLAMRVRCRFVPRAGGFPAPLPPRRAPKRTPTC